VDNFLWPAPSPITWIHLQSVSKYHHRLKSISHILFVCVCFVCARLVKGGPLRLEFLQWFISSLKISSLRRFLFLFWGFGLRVVCVVNFA
jgi:hypothetical protein